MNTPEDYIDRMIDFVRAVGLDLKEEELIEPTILPGLTLSRGGLLVDRQRLRFPGDLLHEAGHLAVKLPADRAATDHTAGDDPAEEMMAMAWAWAAGKHLEIPPEVVFHEAGYHKGNASPLIEQFQVGRWFGVPMLQAYGLTAEPHQAEKMGRPAYPQMTRWLREDADVLEGA